MRIPAGWIGWLGLLACACAKSPRTVVELNDLAVDWEPFRWVEVTIGATTIARASVLVDAKDQAIVGQVSAGTENPMQLDFGFAGVGAWGIPLRLLVPIQTDSIAARKVLEGRIARLGAREDSIGLGRLFRLGTLGLLYYGTKGLIVDQVAQRLGSPRGGAPLPAPIVSRMAWTEAREVGGRLLIPLRWQDSRIGDLAVDPGSSLVPLWVEPETWRRLTGRRGDEPDNLRLAFPTKADSLILVGTRLEAPLSLGEIKVPDVEVFFAASGPAPLIRASLGGGAVGVIGSQLFASYRLLYLNVRSRRLGVLR